MRFITSTLLFAALVSFGTSVVAAPVKRDSCDVDATGFNLQFSSDPDGIGLVALVPNGQDDSGNPVFALTTCNDCANAQIPDSWNLKNGVLSAIFEDAPDGEVTINLPLKTGKVNLVTGLSDELTRSRDYCAQFDDDGDLVLTGNGQDNFQICTFIGTPGPVGRRDIYYNQNSNGIARNCVSAELIIL